MEIIDNNNFRNESKEDLERYYAKEKKSMAEISRIYDYCLPTIKNKLEKYGIPIRPHGALSVDNNGESLSSKYVKGKISWSEYGNDLAEIRGLEDYNEYKREIRYKSGKNLPMSKNKDCAQYLGIYICENKEFLSKILNIVESMKYNNPGYDIVCGKNKKIDVKCACLSVSNKWTFIINKNKVPDYFLMISFDDRESLNIQHIWLIKKDAVIERTSYYSSKRFVFNEKGAITIGKGINSLKRWKSYEITDTYKLEEVQKVCVSFKRYIGEPNAT